MNNRHIIIEEQGLRDGFQTLSKTIPTQKKLDYINQLVNAGVKRIQVASFVHPRLVPQMADAEELCKQLVKKSDVIYSGLVLNVKGVERGIAARLNHLSCSISASDTHSQKNARLTLSEAKKAFRNMVNLSKQNNITVRGGIQCAFGCRYEGSIDENHVLDMVDHHLDTGIDELALADSTGMGNPKQLGNLMQKVVEKAGNIPVVLHLHNTENKGYANLYAAIEAGVQIFDTAFGGLGGCPFIKNATGNIATEDSVHMIHQMGYKTGIDINKIAEISRELETTIGNKLPGQLYQLLNNKDIKMN
ncbi:hydroxymethylglutaryl-CoA lyase [Maribacter vaceletii]|uniref:Hydroxymethylglutaryl-CoA lyase n=1 Tax=Maribacter vaceletii TaxID=1206816 RepID=A0A495EGX1_9FLAO|nr:hydroxymethylglutaryl-CoA lyase [Maribacter vaceletii]RKR15207.1 hydroxymethylglutaryl-CoA lyase [Maribacter vaceletii]